MDKSILPARALPVPEIDQLSNILNWIRFTNTPERIAITIDVFTTYDDLFSLEEKDITELSEAFSRRTTTNRKIKFGVRRTKKLK